MSYMKKYRRRAPQCPAASVYFYEYEDRFEDLSIEEMFEKHDGWYEMSDDHRVWLKGERELAIIKDKVAKLGGWNQELINKWNNSNNPKR